MTKHEPIEAAPLALLRKPFEPHHISKLPKETKAQIDKRKADSSYMVWGCKVCGGNHHKDANHLDYVGHAALTDRLLDTDIQWSWEPLAFTDLGLPAFDQSGGLWIRLTVCGVTRLGYGHAAAKQMQDPGAREKEVIGDALRNAAMRFGAALDLWHKGDLHVEADQPVANDADNVERISSEQRMQLQTLIEATGSNIVEMCDFYKIDSLPELPLAKFAHAKKVYDKKLAKLGEAT